MCIDGGWKQCQYPYDLLPTAAGFVRDKAFVCSFKLEIGVERLNKETCHICKAWTDIVIGGAVTSLSTMAIQREFHQTLCARVRVF